MREHELEDRLCLGVERIGGHAYKFKSVGRRGVPDRIVVVPKGRVFFVELKAPGKKPSPAQAREHNRLRSLCCDVRVLDTVAAVDSFLEEVRRW